jgi:hypothetical protein
VFQFFFTLGVMTSYWIDYAVAKHLESSSLQWRVPVALQLVPGGILGLGMLLTKESVRWLVKRGDHEGALASLTWIRGDEDHAIVKQECVYPHNRGLIYGFANSPNKRIGWMRSSRVSEKKRASPRASHGKNTSCRPTGGD